jgi:hypothetical protein
VLDEPTTGLDPHSRQVVWSTIRELAGARVTVLLTTQYLEEADAVAFGQLAALLAESFATTLLPDRRTISIPAPNQSDDLARAAIAIGDSELHVDEVALRSPDARRRLPGSHRPARNRHGARSGGGDRVISTSHQTQPDDRPGAVRRYVRDSMLLTARSLRSIPRIPERLLDVTIQPIVFILLGCRSSRHRSSHSSATHCSGW